MSTNVWFRQQGMGSVLQLPQQADRSWGRTCAPRNLKHWRPALQMQYVIRSEILLLVLWSGDRWPLFKCYFVLFQAKKRAKWKKTVMALLERTYLDRQISCSLLREKTWSFKCWLTCSAERILVYLDDNLALLLLGTVNELNVFGVFKIHRHLFMTLFNMQDWYSSVIYRGE